MNNIVIRINMIKKYLPRLLFVDIIYIFYYFLSKFEFILV